MSIPIDKLYHYIEGVAQEIYNDDILIYRFFPHGSKKIEDLTPLYHKSHFVRSIRPEIVCNDQEPLNYDYYNSLLPVVMPETVKFLELFKKYLIKPPTLNLRKSGSSNIYDQCILLHSEQRSKDVEKYNNDSFIPVYYWSHGLIARDWFRYAIYEKMVKNVTSTFLIYNRAWSGTREYRLKFIDLLIKADLLKLCNVSFNPVEPDLNAHYNDYTYINEQWRPELELESYNINHSHTTGRASADYDLDDYLSTEIEVVLETLFDDSRLHLTEKVLRPISLGQPFVVAATHGSLEYLRSYGFRTFSSVWDESYDTIEDPYTRLEAVVKTMKEISSWTVEERQAKLELANQIAAYNRKLFFSAKFTDQIKDELKTNLTAALDEIENTNTGTRWLSNRKAWAKHQELKQLVLNCKPKEETIAVLKVARKYYMRTLGQD